MGRVISKRHWRAFYALGLLLATGVSQGEPAVGASAPVLTIRTFDGRALDLSALRGRVVLLNFWASWCAPCRQEMPELDRFYRAHQAQGMVVIGLSIDRERDLKEALRSTSSISYPAGLLTQARDAGWGIPRALPVTYLIDAAGIIRAVLRPGKEPVTTAQLESIVADLGAAVDVAKPGTPR